MSASEAARPSTGGASPTNHSPAASPTHAAAAAAAARQSSPNTSAAPPRTAGNRSREGGRGGTLQAQATSSSSASGLQATARRSLQSRAAQNQDDDDDSLQAPLPTTKASPLDFVEWGPPPDMNQRELIFDSLNKIVTAQTQKGGASTGGGGGGGGYGKGAQAGKGDSRGTYIFTWGAGYHGQLGRKFVRGQKKYSAIPMMVEMNNVIRQVTCGGLHTAVVTEEGKVYTFGDGRRGELGHIHDPSLKQTPRPVEMLDHVFITSVACGGSHTIAIADSGFLYSWGYARFGQLGHGERQNQKFPKRIESPLVKDIGQVACGNKHTLMVTRSGACLATGANRHGQLGLGDFEDRLEPCRLESLRDVPVGYVSCGAIHSCLVTGSGELFITGFGEFYTVQNESQNFFPDPKRVDMPEPIRSVSCGQAHNLALSVNNNVYAFGSGEYGQCGFGIKGNSAMPRLVLDTRNIKQVSAGRYHSFALTDSGILYSWGCGEYGQLGLNSDENILLPTVVTPILGTVVGQVSCGEHHTAILTSAPWTKLSGDVHEWLHAAKVEHELKELYLKKTHRGLTQKDLAKLALEKEKWRVANEARKKDLEQEEKSYIDGEIDSVQFEKELQEEVQAAFQRAERNAPQASSAQQQQQQPTSGTSSMKKLNLPPVADATSASQQEEEEKDTRSGAGQAVTRLPTLGKKKDALAKTGSQTERASASGGGAQAQAQVQPLLLDGAATVRVDRDRAASSGYDATQRDLHSSTDTGYSLLPSARTQFLKETAQMIRRMTHVIHDKGEAQSSRELNETLQQVFAYRKEYDQLKNVSRALVKKAADLKRECDLLESGQHSSTDSKENSDVRLQNLQMQLSTVTIKIAESSENRRNYELNIAHLKEEDFDHMCLHSATLVARADGSSVSAGALLPGTLLVGEHGTVEVAAVQPLRDVHRMLELQTASGGAFTVTPNHRLTVRWNRAPQVDLADDDDTMRAVYWDRITLQPVAREWAVTRAEEDAAESGDLRANEQDCLSGTRSHLQQAARQWLAAQPNVLRSGDIVEVEAADLLAKWHEWRMEEAEGRHQFVSAHRVPLKSVLEVNAPMGDEAALVHQASLDAFEDAARHCRASAHTPNGKHDGPLVLQHFALKALPGGAYRRMVESDSIGVVYQLHSPLQGGDEEGSQTMDSTGTKARTFLAMERAHAALGIDAAKSEIVLAEVNPTAQMRKQLPSSDPILEGAYGRLCDLSCQAVLARGVTRVVAFGRYSRARWLSVAGEARIQTASTSLAASSAEAEEEEVDEAEVESITFESAGVPRTVWFAPHPSAWRETKALVATLAHAHGREGHLATGVVREFLGRSTADRIRSLRVLALPRHLVEFPVTSVEIVPRLDAKGRPVDASRRFAFADGTLTHNSQLKKLRKQNTDTNLYVKKMEDLRGQSHQERAKSEAELSQFKSEIAAYSRFVGDQMTQFQGILDIVRTQNEKREQAKVEREEKATASVAQRVTQLNTEQVSAEKESGSLNNRLVSLDLKLRHFESSFQKISSATGLNHPDAIVNKFFFKGEIREQLQSEIDEKQHALELLRREEENLRADLDQAKLNFKDQTWRDVEQLSESTREVSTRSNKAQKEIERVTQRLAFVQEGLLYLIKHVDSQALATRASSSDHQDDGLLASVDRELPQLDGDGSPTVKGLWTPAQATAVFQKTDHAVDVLFSCIAREQEHRHLLELSSQQRAAATAVQKSTTERVAGGQPPKIFGLMQAKQQLKTLATQQQDEQ